MTKKSKKQAKQEEPAPAVKNTVKEKPAKEQKTKAKAETKAETKAGGTLPPKWTASSLNHSGWMQQTLPPTRKKK